MIRQIIVYEIQSNDLEAFDAIKQQMIRESLRLDGLRSATTARSLNQDNVFVDTMVWESLEAIQASEKTFPQLPTAPRFLSLMSGPPLWQQLVEFQPETI